MFLPDSYDQTSSKQRDLAKLKSTNIVLPKTSSCARLKPCETLDKPHCKFISNPISLKHSLNDDVIGRQNAKGELKYVSPNLDFNILNPIFLNNCNDMFSRNNLNINSDIYPKTSKSNQGEFNCFSMFRKILKDFISPSNLRLSGEKATIFQGIPKKNYAVWEKIRTLTNFINDTHRNNNSNFRSQADQDSRKSASPKTRIKIDILNNDIQYEDYHQQQEFEQENITNYLKQNLPENTEIDPKEYVEFYFIYRTDLQELWRYLRYLGVDMRTFTINEFREILSKQLPSRQFLSIEDEIRQK